MDDLYNLLNNESFKKMTQNMIQNFDAGKMQEMIKSVSKLSTELSSNTNLSADEMDEKAQKMTENIKDSAKTMFGSEFGNIIDNLYTPDNLDKIQTNFMSQGFNTPQDLLKIKNPQDLLNSDAFKNNLSTIASIVTDALDVDKVDMDEYFKLRENDYISCNTECLICRDEYEKDDNCCKCENDHLVHKDCYLTFLKVNHIKKLNCAYCDNKMVEGSYLFEKKQDTNQQNNENNNSYNNNNVDEIEPVD